MSHTATMGAHAPAPFSPVQALTLPPGVVDPFSADADARVHKEYHLDGCNSEGEDDVPAAFFLIEEE